MLCSVVFVRIDVLFLHKVLRLLVSANVAPSSPIRVTLMMEEIRSFESRGITSQKLLIVKDSWNGNVASMSVVRRKYTKANIKQNKTNSVALRPRANYTDWATAICRRNLVSTFVDKGVSRGQRGGSPTVVNLSFLDRSRYFSFT
jgi:hypothetical protein